MRYSSLTLTTAGALMAVALAAAGCSLAGPSAPPTPLTGMDQLVTAWEQATGQECAREGWPTTFASESLACTDSAVLSVYAGQGDVEAMVEDSDTSYRELGGDAVWLVGQTWTINDSTLDYEAFSAKHGGETVTLGSGPA